MENFKLLVSNSQDPCFNLAIEEFLLKNKTEYYVFIWQNAPSVIVGTNQNTISEVNLTLAQEKGVKIVRRITGGGAVYHDLGNINFSIIAPFNADENRFATFTLPVIEYLSELGINASLSGRNDIVVDGKKISGNAEIVYKNRVLHHGTLLFDTDLSALSVFLTPSKLKLESKGVKSVRSRVINIKEFTDISIKDFISGLISKFELTCERFEISSIDKQEILKLVSDKYCDYNWNIGSSPKGTARVTGRFNFGTMTFCFNLIDGRIADAEIYGDFFSKKDVKEFTARLNGVKMIRKELIKAFSDISEYIDGADWQSILYQMF